METYYKEKFAEVSYNKEQNSVWVVYNGFDSVEKFKFIMDKVFEAVKKYKASFTVADARKLSLVKEEGVEYSVEISKKMYQLGVKNHFIIQPDSYFTQLSVHNYSSKLEGIDFNVHNIASMEELVTKAKELELV